MSHEYEASIAIDAARVLARDPGRIRHVLPPEGAKALARLIVSEPLVSIGALRNRRTRLEFRGLVLDVDEVTLGADRRFMVEWERPATGCRVSTESIQEWFAEQSVSAVPTTGSKYGVLIDALQRRKSVLNLSTEQREIRYPSG